MFQRGTRNSLVAVIGLGAILATAAAALGQSPNDTWWPGYGNGADNSRYFASRQINKSNVNQLRAAWTYAYGDTTWTFHTVPRPGEFGYETWPKDAWKYVGGTNNWGELTVDTRRGIAYTPLGSPPTTSMEPTDGSAARGATSTTAPLGWIAYALPRR
jgi:glucose dehydrogenase